MLINGVCSPQISQYFFTNYHHQVMNNFYAHKRAKTFLQATQNQETNPENRCRVEERFSYKRQFNTNFPSKGNIPLNFKGAPLLPTSKLSGSHASRPNLSHFPRASDFLQKNMKGEQTDAFLCPKIPPQFQQKNAASDLAKETEKIGSKGLFLSTQLPARQRNPVSPNAPIRIPSFLLAKKLSSKSKAAQRQKEAAFFFGCSSVDLGSTKLKETRSTLNLNTTEISQVFNKGEEQPECLDLSFEIDEILNRSADQKLACDIEAAGVAVKALQLLLDRE